MLFTVIFFFFMYKVFFKGVNWLFVLVFCVSFMYVAPVWSNTLGVYSPPFPVLKKNSHILQRFLWLCKPLGLLDN